MIGHGKSRQNSTNQLIDATPVHLLSILRKENIQKVHLLGVSMGSLIAQYFGYCYPEYVLSITAIGGYNIHSKDKTITRAQWKSNIGMVCTALFSMTMFRKKSCSNFNNNT